MKRLLAVLCAVALVAAAFVTIPALGATRSVSLRDNYFAPRSLTVRRGTIVKFVWRGKNLHNIRTTSAPRGGRFQVAPKTRGSYRKRFTRRGTYRLLCSIHAPRMRMTLRVQ
jgi:plastocyanin